MCAARRKLPVCRHAPHAVEVPHANVLTRVYVAAPMHRYMHAYAREVRVWEATADELLSRALVATLRDLRDAEV